MYVAVRHGPFGWADIRIHIARTSGMGHALWHTGLSATAQDPLQPCGWCRASLTLRDGNLDEEVPALPCGAHEGVYKPV